MKNTPRELHGVFFITICHFGIAEPDSAVDFDANLGSGIKNMLL